MMPERPPMEACAITQMNFLSTRSHRALPVANEECEAVSQTHKTSWGQGNDGGLATQMQ
jgi:hypothetical protein